MGNFEQAIKWLRKGKVLVDKDEKNSSHRYFLFSDGAKMYYVHDETINEDKKKLAIKNCDCPHLVSGGWIGKSWEIYEEENTKEKKVKAPGVFIERAALCTIEGIRAICGTDEEYSEYVRNIKQFSTERKK